MIEVLKQMVDVLEYWDVYGGLHQPTEDAIEAGKQAIAQLESQEPVVQETLHWYAFNYRQAHTSQAHEMWLKLEKFVDRKMNTTPPQRTEPIRACVYCGQLVIKENT